MWDGVEVWGTERTVRSASRGRKRDAKPPRPSEPRDLSKKGGDVQKRQDRRERKAGQGEVLHLLMEVAVVKKLHEVKATTSAWPGFQC